MRHPVWLGLVLLSGACQGHLIENPFGETNPPPTSTAALGLHFGGTGSELVADVAGDPAGNIYLAGTFTGGPDFDPGAGITVLNSLGGADVFLGKYSPAGALIWISRIGGTGAEGVTSLARDTQGNLYVGGGFEGATDFDPGPGFQILNSVGGEDGYIAKYSPSGDLLWVRRFGGIGTDEVADVSVDFAGNVYAGGVFTGQANTLPTTGPTIVSDGSATDGFLLALDPSGTVRWALPVGGSQDDAVRGVAATSGGYVTITGTFRSVADFSRNGAPTRLTSQGGTDAFLASYLGLGVLQWARGIGGLAEESVSLGGLSLDSQDGPVMLGRFSGTVDFDPGAGTASRNSISAADVFLARYDAAGAFTSVAALGGQGSLTGVRVLVDLNGSALVTGSFAGSIDFDPGAGAHALASFGQNGATDGFVARYSPVGAFLWVSRFGESTTVPDRSNSGTALALDPLDRVLVAGRFFGSPDFDPGDSAFRLTSLGEADAFVVLLTASGALAVP